MASVINTNIAATRTHNVYSRNNDYMNAAMTKVATGMKINSAKDGASTWAISEKMRERIRANDQANQNVQNDTALLKTAQGGISNTIDILKTLKERAVNAANGSNTTSDRDRIAVEVQELLAQIDDNTAKVKFNGRTLLDGAGGTEEKSKFSASDSTSSSSSVTAPSPVNPPDGTTGSHALFSLGNPTTQDSSKTLGDLGFKANDVIKFTWKEGSDSKEESITVTDTTKTVADLATMFGTSGTSSKLTLKDIANSTAVTDSAGANVTNSSGNISNNSGAGALYAIGAADETQITDLAVAVTGADGATNTAAQAAMKFTGVQQADVTPTADHAVASITGLAKSGVAAANTDKLADLTPPSGGDAIGNAYTITVKIGTETGTYALGSANDTIDDFLNGISGLNNTKLGWFADQVELMDKAGNKVTDSDGNVVKANGAGLYAIGKSGEAVTSFSIEVKGTDNSAKTTALNSFTTNYKYAAASTDDGGDGGSGKTTSLTFYIGGEKGFGITANISSMKVEDLFGKKATEISTMFTDKSTAESAIDLIDTALNKALNEQTKLGAMENRLGYTSDNLVTMNENLEAADSVMRDSDIAKEMTQYMKYAVLSQASQYMLAQAGQNAFQVLNLLQP